MTFLCYCTCFLFVKNVKQLCKHLFNKTPLYDLENKTFSFFLFVLFFSNPWGFYIKTARTCTQTATSVSDRSECRYRILREATAYLWLWNTDSHLHFPPPQNALADQPNFERRIHHGPGDTPQGLSGLPILHDSNGASPQPCVLASYIFEIVSRCTTRSRVFHSSK
jgi:hypothetical protein